MRRPLVVGNWKMNGTLESTKWLLADLLSGVNQVNADIGVCVPFVYIPAASEQLAGSKIFLGSQNVGDYEAGAYTGEVSAPMLKEFGCRFAIVGHSERRILYGETDQLVAARYAQALAGDVTPILCVGETLDQREGGETFDVVKRQLQAMFDVSGAESLNRAVIAYEPVWAIGTGKTATTEQAQEVHAFIRDCVSQHDGNTAEAVRILYGGSVKPDNAAALFAMPDIDGGLVGGASLDAQSFLAICKSTGSVG